MTRRWPRTFSDRITAPLPRPRDMLRLQREGGFHGRESPDRELGQVPTVDQPLPALAVGQSSLTWIGHASYLIRTGGQAILTDPVWSEAIPGRIRRRTAPGLAWDLLPAIDAVLLSHNHYDHLDAPTIRRLPRDTPIFAPAALGRWFRRRGFSAVTELDWWEHATVGDLSLEFVPAHHWTRRGVFDLNRTLWGGWLIQAPDGPMIYYAGDSAYGTRFTEIAERHPRIDLAILPIGAYAPRWFMGNAHLDPAQAVQAAIDVGARRMAWMHWGTFVLSAEPMAEPARLTRTAWAEAGLRAEDLWDLAIGETRVWDASCGCSPRCPGHPPTRTPRESTSDTTRGDGPDECSHRLRGVPSHTPQQPPGAADRGR